MWGHQVGDGHELADVIANDLGDRTTHCYVSHTGEELAVGAAAKSTLVRNRHNTASAFTSLLGASFKDVPAGGSVAHCCKVVDKDGRPGFAFDDHDEVFLPEALATHVVKALRATATTKTTAKHCVVGVPVQASAAARAALVEVVHRAGFHCQQVLAEPVAAVLAYGCGQDAAETPETVLVFDMGATQLTLALIAVRGGVLREVAAVVKPGLGGHAFDEALVDFLVRAVCFVLCGCVCVCVRVAAADSRRRPRSLRRRRASRWRRTRRRGPSC